MSNEKDDIGEQIKNLPDEELELFLTEKRRREAERDKQIREKVAYVRYTAFARCNKCGRALSEDVFRKNTVCPYCGGESAELIEYDE